MIIIYFAILILYFLFCNFINEIFKTFFPKLRFKYKRIPKKYIGKQTPIYKIEKVDATYCNVIKYRLYYVEQQYSILYNIIPIPIIYLKIEYVEDYKASNIRLYPTLDNPKILYSYDDLVKQCELSLYNFNQSERKKLDAEKNINDLNKIFNDNFVE